MNSGNNNRHEGRAEMNIKGKDKQDKAKDFEKALREEPAERYVLRLFVSGSTPRSARAIRNIKKVCEEHLAGRYELEVIDVYQQPGAAKDADIIATPMLVKNLPVPLRKFIGDLSDVEKILVGLNLLPKR